MVVQIKALACELPSTSHVPLSRWSTRDLAAQARQAGLVAAISGTTIWRWLNEDAIRPWQRRCWIFPRDSGDDSVQDERHWVRGPRILGQGVVAKVQQARLGVNGHIFQDGPEVNRAPSLRLVLS